MILGLSLQKKWKGLRDTFVREMKKHKNAPSGSGASKSNYVYFQRLMFLERSVRIKPNERNVTETPEINDNELNSTEDGREDILRAPSQNIKRKKMSAADTEFLNIIKHNIGSRNQQHSKVPCIMESDDDKLFCLSLHKELLKVSEVNRMEVKILQKAQQSSNRTTYSDDTYSLNNNPSTSINSVLPSIPSQYQTQMSRSKQYVFQEYDPTTPSIIPPQSRISTSTPIIISQEVLYSPSPTSRDSQNSEYLECKCKICMCSIG